MAVVTVTSNDPKQPAGTCRGLLNLETVQARLTQGHLSHLYTPDSASYLLNISSRAHSPSTIPPHLSNLARLLLPHTSSPPPPKMKLVMLIVWALTLAGGIIIAGGLGSLTHQLGVNQTPGKWKGGRAGNPPWRSVKVRQRLQRRPLPRIYTPVSSAVAVGRRVT